MLHRKDIYTIGHPAQDGVYQPFIDFAMEYTGQKILDAGCGNGNYAADLVSRGKAVEGLEYTSSYAKEARKKGIKCVIGDARKMPFKEKEFDTTVLFEVVEHIENPLEVIREAMRVSRKNVLVTVPNSTNLALMKENGLTYYHMITEDHVNFFSYQDFEDMAKKLGVKVKVIPSEPISLLNLLDQNIAYRALRYAYAKGWIGTDYHYRIYAVFYRD